MHLKSFNPQKSLGFTLIELLIGLTLGLMVIASTLTLYVITTRSSSDLLHSTRLNHDLETIMQIMTHDSRRAGYQGLSLLYKFNLICPCNDPTDSCIKQQRLNIDNALTTILAPSDYTIKKSNKIWVIVRLNNQDDKLKAANHLKNKLSLSEDKIPNLQIHDYGLGREKNCILYSYDDDDDLKNIGFRWRKDDDDFEVIEARKSGPDNADCTNSCNSWESITEKNVTQITELTFSDTESQCFNATDPNQPTSTGLCTTPANTGVDDIASSSDSITKISHITIELKGRTLPKDPGEQLCDDDNPCTPEKTLKASVTVANPYTYVKP
jgi:hypothetical protein